jgi:hypothetical protein
MVGQVFVNIFRGIDVVRKFLHLVLLLLIFGVLVGALKGSIPRIADQSALVVAPTGELVEQLSGDAIDQAIARAQG